jgi:hypothetical protein
MCAPLRFTADAVALVPEGMGAYVLFKGPQPLFAGMAAGGATLRSELTAHLRGDFGPRTRAATHFTWRATAEALEAYHLQIAAHARWDLREPVCQSSERKRYA